MSESDMIKSRLYVAAVDAARELGQRQGLVKSKGGFATCASEAAPPTGWLRWMRWKSTFRRQESGLMMVIC